MIKHVFLVILFVLHISPVKCQYKYGSSLPDSALSLLNSRSGTLYAGIDNPISLNLCKPENINEYILFSNNGTAFIDSLWFTVIPARTGLSRIVLMKIEDNDTIIIGQRFYSVKSIPEPKLQIDTIRFESLSFFSRSALLAADSISIFISSDIINSDNWFKVNRFTIGYIYGGLYKQHLNQGNRISLETKMMINNLSPGKEVIFNIFAEGEGKLIVELPVYRLKLY
ncbi:MAG: GldM family protein [Bacteroidales bacterium]